MTVEQVRALREAVAMTVATLWPIIKDGLHSRTWEGTDNIAARLYPMPMIEVPRVARSNEDQYRLVNGKLQHRTSDRQPWIDAQRILQRTHAIMDILANPTEQRPADEAPDA